MKIQTLCRKLKVIVPRHGKVLPIPTPSTVTDCGELMGFSFPLDYSLFVARYGAGELASFYRIHCPFAIDDDATNHIDIESFNKRVRARNGRLDSYGNQALTDRLVLFCSTIGGDWYAWDPADVRDKARHEYPIIEMLRESDKPREVSHSFADFVEKCCTRALWAEEDATADWTYTRS